MDPNGPKLVKSCKGQICNKLILQKIFGGRGRDRTGDPLLAKQVLSQLSYTPILIYSKRLVSLWYIIAYAGSI